MEHAQCEAVLGAVRSPVYRAVLAVMYGCGLRIGEAITLTVSDVDAAHMVIRVVGKGNKERLVPLSAPLHRDLQRMWTGHHHPQWLFGNKLGTNHVDGTAICKAFRLACTEAHIQEKVTPHCLRHSFASRLMERNVAVETIGILMGHTSIKTTQTYLHLTVPMRKTINDTVTSFCIPLFDFD